MQMSKKNLFPRSTSQVTSGHIALFNVSQHLKWARVWSETYFHDLSSKTQCGELSSRGVSIAKYSRRSSVRQHPVSTDLFGVRLGGYTTLSAEDTAHVYIPAGLTGYKPVEKTICFKVEMNVNLKQKVDFRKICLNLITGASSVV